MVIEKEIFNDIDKRDLEEMQEKLMQKRRKCQNDRDTSGIKEMA